MACSVTCRNGARCRLISRPRLHWLFAKGGAVKVLGWIAGPTISIAVAAFLAWLGGFHR